MGGVPLLPDLFTSAAFTDHRPSHAGAEPRSLAIFNRRLTVPRLQYTRLSYARLLFEDGKGSVPRCRPVSIASIELGPQQAGALARVEDHESFRAHDGTSHIPRLVRGFVWRPRCPNSESFCRTTVGMLGRTDKSRPGCALTSSLFRPQ